MILSSVWMNNWYGKVGIEVEECKEHYALWVNKYWRGLV